MYHYIEFLLQIIILNRLEVVMEEQERNYVQLDKYVILVDNRDEKRLLKPCDHKNFKWRRIPVKLSMLNKFEYYQSIEVGNDTLKAVEDQSDGEQNQEEVVEQNNKQIYVSEKTQKLEAEQILKLKNDKNPDEIIDTLVNNNAQFDKRTAYSKEKYLNKKKKKYLFRFHVEPVSLEAIQLYYYESQITSIASIRSDIFGFILLQGSPYKRVLLAQQTKGLFLASMLIKQAQSITVYADEAKNLRRFPIVQQMNISKKQADQKIQYKLWNALKEEKGTFSNMMLAGNYQFGSIFEEAFPHLEQNCLICFFCQHLSPLQEAMARMLENDNLIHVKLFDSWARVYQVLKNRTHPNMSMYSNSGYVLTAIKVEKP